MQYFGDALRGYFWRCSPPPGSRRGAAARSELLENRCADWLLHLHCITFRSHAQLFRNSSPKIFLLGICRFSVLSAMMTAANVVGPLLYPKPGIHSVCFTGRTSSDAPCRNELALEDPACLMDLRFSSYEDVLPASSSMQPSQTASPSPHPGSVVLEVYPTDEIVVCRVRSCLSACSRQHPWSYSL